MINLFGSFLNGSMPLFNGSTFYPLNNNGYYGDKKSPIIVDMTNLLAVYLACPPLRAIIDKKADMFSSMGIKLYKYKEGKNGEKEKEEVKNHKILDLLKTPSPLHGQNNWLQLYSIYKDIYNQAFIYKLKGTSIGYPKVLWHLPPGDMKINPTGKLFSQYQMSDIIKNYVLISGADEGRTETVYQVNEVIHITEGTSFKYIVGESKLKTLELPISNIIGAYKTRNILIHENAGLTILSPDSKDADGMLPFGDTERLRLEHEFRMKYGLRDDQMHKVFTTTKMSVTPLIFPVKDMMLFEEIEGDFSEICQAYGMGRDIFPSTKGATYENQLQAEKRTYQDTIIPEAEKFIQYLNTDKDLALTEQGLFLEPCFEHIDILKDDEKTEYEAEKVEYEGQKIKSDSIMALNKAVQLNEISYDSAIQMAVTIHEYPMEIATKLISKQITKPATPPTQQ